MCNSTFFEYCLIFGYVRVNFTSKYQPFFFRKLIFYGLYENDFEWRELLKTRKEKSQRNEKMNLPL